MEGEGERRGGRGPPGQVVETNIVRGRGVRRKNAARRGGEKERQTSALESMRMSGGRERQRSRKSDREIGRNAAGEARGGGGRRNKVRERTDAVEGATSALRTTRAARRGTAREGERAAEVQENRLPAEGAEGSTRGQDPRRMRGGRGNARSRSDTVPSFSFAPLAEPFSFVRSLLLCRP